MVVTWKHSRWVPSEKYPYSTVQWRHIYFLRQKLSWALRPWGRVPKWLPDLPLMQWTCQNSQCWFLCLVGATISRIPEFWKQRHWLLGWVECLLAIVRSDEVNCMFSIFKLYHCIFLQDKTKLWVNFHWNGLDVCTHLSSVQRNHALHSLDNSNENPPLIGH